MRPIVQWKVITNLEDFPYGRPASPWEIVWDGDPAKIIIPPANQRLIGYMQAFAGKKEIGNVALASHHSMNHPSRITITAFSIFFPKKMNGGYGKDFGDVEDYQTRKIKKPFNLQKAIEYVEKPFYDFWDEVTG
jgi:hypothetical protein